MVQLTKGVNSKNNQEVYFASGNTYAIKDKLKALGFKWYGVKKSWWIYANKLDASKISALQRLGIDTSVAGGTAVSQPDPRVVAPGVEPAAPEEAVPELTNKTDTDSGKMMKDIGFNFESTYDKIPGRYGFPIKSNIYSTDMMANVDEQEIPLKIVMHRWYKKGRRKIPSYIYGVYYNDKLVSIKGIMAPGEWGTYNEDQIASESIGKVQEMINAKAKMYKQINYYLELEKRDAAFAKFLEDWDNAKYDDKTFVDQYIPTKTLHLDEPGYKGDYKIGFNLLGGSVYLETKVDHPLARSSATLERFSIPATIRNLDEFNSFIDEFIANNSDKMKAKYMKYLQSFPFKQEEEEQSRGDMEEVINMIGNNYDIHFFKSKLADLGYIRPSKKTKKEERAPGMMPQGKIKWILESKKIVNDAYSYGANPNSFYSVIAYWLHRKAKRISSWTDMMLSSAIDHWYRMAKQYGHEIDYKTIQEYFDKISSDLYRELFDKEPSKGVGDNYRDFYSGGSKGRRVEGPGTAQSPETATNEFVSFVTILGVDPQVAKNNPKAVYRQLAIKFHPDLNPDNPDAERTFGQLSTLYNNLPIEITRANNWYNKIVFSSLKRKQK